MWWSIIIICIVSGFIYLLFAPIFIEINTASSLYRIRFHRLLSASLLFTEESALVGLKVVIWQARFDLLATQKRVSEPATAERERKGSTSIPISTFIALIKSFRIKKFLLTLDTGNMSLNGILFPAFLWVGKRYNQNISINFLNNNMLILQIENKIVRILWAFVKATILK